MVYQQAIIDKNGCIVAEFSNHLAAFEAMAMLYDPQWRPAYAKTYMTDDDLKLFETVRDAKFIRMGD